MIRPVRVLPSAALLALVLSLGCGSGPTDIAGGGDGNGGGNTGGGELDQTGPWMWARMGVLARARLRAAGHLRLRQARIPHIPSCRILPDIVEPIEPL